MFFLYTTYRMSRDVTVYHVKQYSFCILLTECWEGLCLFPEVMSFLYTSYITSGDVTVYCMEQCSFCNGDSQLNDVDYVNLMMFLSYMEYTLVHGSYFEKECIEVKL